MIRSALFVPATRIDRIEKAFATGADTVIVDLEDAVAADSKSSARQALADFLTTHTHAKLWVRINGADTDWFDEDLVLCQRFEQIQGIMLPKAESSEQIQRISNQVDRAIYPIIESAKGLGALSEIAHTKGVAQLSFGALDLGVDLGLDQGSQGADFLLNQMRVQLVIHSRCAGLASPLDGVYPDFKNLEGLRQSLSFSKGMGFGGALCIHPSQVAVIHDVMCFSEQEKQWAKAVLDKYHETGLAAFALDGKMVDMPVILKAKQILGD